MFKIINIIDRTVKVISISAAGVGCCAILLMALIVTTNSVFRYAFNMPLLFADEYAQYLLVVVFYFGVGYTFRAGRHVYVSLIIDRLGASLARPLKILIFLASVGTIGLMAYYSWTAFLSTAKAGIVSITPMETPLAYPFFAVALGMTIFTLEVFVALLKELFGVEHKTFGQ